MMDRTLKLKVSSGTVTIDPKDIIAVWDLHDSKCAAITLVEIRGGLERIKCRYHTADDILKAIKDPHSKVTDLTS